MKGSVIRKSPFSAAEKEHSRGDSIYKARAPRKVDEILETNFVRLDLQNKGTSKQPLNRRVSQKAKLSKRKVDVNSELEILPQMP